MSLEQEDAIGQIGLLGHRGHGVMPVRIPPGFAQPGRDRGIAVVPGVNQRAQPVKRGPRLDLEPARCIDSSDVAGIGPGGRG